MGKKKMIHSVSHKFQMDQNLCLWNRNRNISAADTKKASSKENINIRKNPKLNTQGQISDVPMLSARGNKYSIYNFFTRIKSANTLSHLF